MTIIQDIIETARGLLADSARSKLPPTVDIEYPANHPLAGKKAGVLVLEHGTGGATSYKRHDLPVAVPRIPGVAELVIAHKFSALPSLIAFLGDHHPGAQVFASSDDEGCCVRAVLDAEEPQHGEVRALLRESGAFERWDAKIPCDGEIHELSHLEFADLLLDNKEDLAEEAVALAISTLRTAKTVDYDADMDTRAAQNVRVKWSKGNDANVAIPREFVANISGFADVRPGAPVKMAAKFRVRVVAGDDVAPVFRVLWVNSNEFATWMFDDVMNALRTGLPETPVFEGTPSSQRFAPLHGG